MDGGRNQQGPQQYHEIPELGIFGEWQSVQKHSPCAYFFSIHLQVMVEGVGLNAHRCETTLSIKKKYC